MRRMFCEMRAMIVGVVFREWELGEISVCVCVGLWVCVCVVRGSVLPFLAFFFSLSSSQMTSRFLGLFATPWFANLILSEAGKFRISRDCVGAGHATCVLMTPSRITGNEDNNIR